MLVPCHCCASSHVSALGSAAEQGCVSICCSVSKLLSGRQSKSCSPGVIFWQFWCCYFCCEMCFTVSPSVNMLTSCIHMAGRMCDLWFCCLHNVPDTSWMQCHLCTVCVCACLFVACGVPPQSSSDIHCLAHGHVGNVDVSIRCNWRHVSLPAHLKASIRLLERRNQNNFFCN